MPVQRTTRRWERVLWVERVASAGQTTALIAFPVPLALTAPTPSTLPLMDCVWKILCVPVALLELDRILMAGFAKHVATAVASVRLRRNVNCVRIPRTCIMALA